MTDNTLKEDDELIPIETAPEEDEDSKVETDASDDDDDEDDARLAESDEDSEEEIRTSRNKRRSGRRRDIHRRAKETAEQKIQYLEQQNAEMLRRLSSVEGHALNSNAQTLDERLQKAQRDVQQAEHFIAKATEAGNGEDVVAAMRIRDQAMAETNQLQQARYQFEEARKQSTTPQVNPAVVNYAKEWMQANSWYDPSGRDRDSALTKAIDNEVVQEGYNPATREYWEELTARVADALGEETPASKPKRRGPPTGNTREHAPVSTKREIYVTPERKQAMIDAGVWEDATLRQRYLKAYQSYDAGPAR